LHGYGDTDISMYVCCVACAGVDNGDIQSPVSKVRYLALTFAIFEIPNHLTTFCSSSSTHWRSRSSSSSSSCSSTAAMRDNYLVLE